jgi:hypothetical protein
LGSWGFQRASHFQGEMRKGEMGTARAGKPPNLPRERRTLLRSILKSLPSFSGILNIHWKGDSEMEEVSPEMSHLRQTEMRILEKADIH